MTTPSSPEGFRLLRLELAREHDNPAGSGDHGYDVVAPLLGDDRLDPLLWKRNKDACRVVRFRPDEEHSVGRLVRRPGGSWAFRFSGETDEAGYHFDKERFVPGEYVSVRYAHGEHTFKIVSVRPL